jgi:hypothetical protein
MHARREGVRRILRTLTATAIHYHRIQERLMKGMDQKKEQKKKPAKTMKEKKAEKRDKKANKGFAPV